MTTGTGLDAQVGFKLETTVGTEVTVDKFVEFDSEGLEFDPGFIEPSGLRVGTKFKRGSRLVQSRNMVSGDLTYQHATRTMGTFWKAALGSSVTTPTLIAGSAYKQIHQTGDLLGKSLTVQVGRPEPSTGTVRAHTYRGCKVTGWEFSCSDNDTARMTLSFDGWNEATATALATASFVSSEVFNFSQATQFKLGVTVSGTTELTVSAGTSVAAIVRSITFKGESPMATERYGLGNAGTKKEQLENDVPTITGAMDIEYLQSEWYTPFKANTAQSLYLLFEGSIISGSDKNSLEFIVPQMNIKKVTPKVDGPDIVKASVEFEIYTNATAQNAFQVKLISADSAAI